MKGWRFSWRATIAWLLGSLVSGLLLGGLLAALNIVTSPEDKDEFVIDTVALIAMGWGVFLVLSGVPELIVSVLWRTGKWWLRPWFDMLLGGALCFALVHAPGVNISVGLDLDGVSASTEKLLIFLAIEVAPVVAGALAPLVYWLIAKPKRD